MIIMLYTILVIIVHRLKSLYYFQERITHKKELYTLPGIYKIARTIWLIKHVFFLGRAMGFFFVDKNQFSLYNYVYCGIKGNIF